jgi:hypothetical protein
LQDSGYDTREVEDNAIQEATYLSLVERNTKLDSQILALEDTLFTMEETLIGLQRKLILVRSSSSFIFFFFFFFFL